MDVIFLRTNNSNFKLLPTRSCSSEASRLLREVVREVEAYLGYETRFFDRHGRECGGYWTDGRYFQSQNWNPAQKIVSYAKRHSTYKFWEFVNIPTDVFKYDSVEGLFEKLVTNNKTGMTMEEGIPQIKRQLKWQELVRCK